MAGIEKGPTNSHPASTEEIWDARAGSWRPDARPHTFVIDFLATHKDALPNDGKALDIGCGPGTYIGPLLECGLEVFGTDISQNMVDRAKASLQVLAPEQQAKVKLEKAASTSLPFPDATFDIATSFGVLHYNDENGVTQSFKEANRVLKSGAFFLVQVRSVNDTDRARTAPIPTAFGFMATDTEGDMRVPVQYFSIQGLRRLGEINGFDIVEGPTEDHPQDGGKSRPSQKRLWVVFQKK